VNGRIASDTADFGPIGLIWREIQATDALAGR